MSRLKGGGRITALENDLEEKTDTRTGAVIRGFSIDRVELAPELLKVQELMPVQPEDRANLKEDIQAHGIREPLKVYEDNKRYYVLAGATRLSIARELGFTEIPIERMDYLPKDDREQFAIDDNLNRRHLTRAQKRALIDRELKTAPHQSSRVIAEKTGTNHTTVSNRRKQLQSTGEISQLTKTTGKDGKSRKEPAKRKPSAPDTAPEPTARKEDTGDTEIDDLMTRLELQIIENRRAGNIDKARMIIKCARVRLENQEKYLKV